MQVHKIHSKKLLLPMQLTLRLWLLQVNECLRCNGFSAPPNARMDLMTSLEKILVCT